MIKCIECSDFKERADFAPMRISTRGRCLLCIDCLAVAIERADFWLYYSRAQNKIKLATIDSGMRNYAAYVQALKNYGPIVYAKSTITLPMHAPPKNRYRTKYKKKIRLMHLYINYVPKISGVGTQISTPYRAGKLIIQYDNKGFEVGSYTDVFEASQVTGIKSSLIAAILDTDSTVRDFKFVHA